MHETSDHARTQNLAERIRQLELEGWTIAPAAIDHAHAMRIREDVERWPLACSSYTDKQHFRHNLQWDAIPSALDAVEATNVLALLSQALGDEALCVSMSYARSDPGYPGMPLHCDSHPYGSNILGASGTAPILLRVLIYLDDLTDDRAPLRVVPYSHLSLHKDAMPYMRYRSHPDERCVLCRRGDAVIINQRLFHAAGPNRSNESRSVLAISYRPAWAGPVLEMSEPDPDLLARLPPRIRQRFAGPNRRTSATNIVNWSTGLPSEAAGLGPSRWD